MLLFSALPALAWAAPLDAGLLDRALTDALRPHRHPRLFVSGADLAIGRANAKGTPWGQTYLARQRAAAASFAQLDDAALRALVPPPGSQFVYGLGMNWDPLRRQRLTWPGWSDPFSLRASDGTRYPNTEWPDAGSGHLDPGSGERFYFLAHAHGRILQALEQTVLPALADVYALTGSQPHARAAAVLLDAIAAVYPTNRRGPLDYPTSPADFDRGGRLDRPYYQVARGLANYGFVIDLVAPSGEFERASHYGTFSVGEHLARNLLWDGGAYCHDFAQRGHQLHNGHADYLRGAALVGVLLDVRALAEPLITGPLSLSAMLDVNIDRNGFYYETSPSYAAHNRTLYVDLAEILVAMRRLGWRDVPDAYTHPNFRLYLTAPFNRQEVGGHLPAIGDAGPDKSVLPPNRRIPARPPGYSDSFIADQLSAAWIQLVRGADADRIRAAQLLADVYAAESTPAPGAERWTIYHVDAATVALARNATPDPARLATGSVFYGAKGLALLRGGRETQRHGAQLFFGPGHNHSQRESLTWTFFSRGAEWSYDPGYFNKHYRMSWTSQSVAHLALVVDGQSHPWENGAARLVAWQAMPAVQWAMATHPDLYDQLGVTRFERLIAQVSDPASGEPAYWLDFGRVEGGKTRDDSFHSQLTALSADLPMPPADPARPTLFGRRDLGAAVLASDHLAGFDAKNFYLVAPGDGYGFLGTPREIPLSSPRRLTFSRPLFATTLSGVQLVADYLGAPGRRLIVAQGGAPFGVMRVPYVIQRDQGPGRSEFTKVIRIVDSPADDPLLRIEPVPLTSEPPDHAATSLLVTWRNGRRDLWIMGDDTGATLHAEPPGCPAVSTDATVAWVHFDSHAAPRQIAASGARALRVAGGPQLTSAGRPRGRVVSVDAATVTLRVQWDAPAAVPTGHPLVTTPPFGASATWTVAASDADTVQLHDATLALAQTELRPVAGKPGVFTFAVGISRFYSGGNRINTRYALGKAVYAGETFLGRIRRIEGQEPRFTLEGPGVGRITTPTTVRILEVAEGDRVSAAADLTWKAQP